MNAERAPAPLEDEPQEVRFRAAPQDEPPPTRIDIPWSVFVKGIVALLVMQGLFRFFQQVTAVVVILALALFLTAALSPLAAWIERRGVKRGLASLLAVGAAILVILALAGLVVPPLVIEVIEFVNDLPLHLERLQRLSTSNPELFRALEQIAQRVRQDPRAFFAGFLRAGASAAGLIFSGVLILTLALYFLLDQEQIRKALLDHLPRRHRDRVDLTITEVARGSGATVGRHRPLRSSPS